ncbi:hypothetical protein [Streptomyces sp. NPDC049813]|uniref:hypothetical protein n=1 Tax=Streptomyces sp. NPDC049813 TaxID=3365597 RepID=UPI0037913C4F
MEQQRMHDRVFGAWLLGGLVVLAGLRVVPRALSAPFAACAVCDVLGFVLLFMCLVLGVRAAVRRSVA